MDNKLTLINKNNYKKAKDQYNKVILNLDLYAHDFKTIMFTSSLNRENRTYTLINLVISMSKLNKKILIIDADMYKSKLSNSFSGEVKNNLNDYLLDKCTAKDIIYNTDLNGVKLLPSKPDAEGLSLLVNERFEALIADQKANYDYILINTAPMSLYGDVNVVAKCCEGSILVVRERRVKRQQYEDNVKRLNDLISVGNHFIGLIFCKF
ncbi:MAG: CpsD/CapB family tyrosine-protein kinase [Erysipelotrichaceae bacterium]|nr:CpsD/CapB family tyrosine-protein kinase [Erysipelotrichaceae bacterium]